MSNLTFRQRKLRDHATRWLIALILIVFAIFPVVWMLSASFNQANSLASATLIPRQLTLDNYRTLFNTPETPFLRWMWNSVKISSITTVLSVSITTLAAYAFSASALGRGRICSKASCSSRFSLVC